MSLHGEVFSSCSCCADTLISESLLVSTCVAVQIFSLQDGLTALMYAALHGRTDSVRLLLEVGANKDARAKVRGKGGYFPTRMRLFL
jgi:ankyrin repeat protein